MAAPDAVDQSWSSLSPASARARGIKIVWDYLSHDPSKDWTAPQIKNYLAAGVGCGFLWETTANRALSGAAAGLSDGRDAAAELNGLIRAVGITPPSKLSIIAAVDFDTNPSQYPTIKAYTSNFRAGLASQFLTGIYGEADLLDALGSLIDVGFQTYAWSGGRISGRAALYQYSNGQSIDGAVVDFDRIIRAAELGAWWPAGLVPAGGGTLITPGGDMPLDAVDIGKIHDDDIGIWRSNEVKGIIAAATSAQTAQILAAITNGNATVNSAVQAVANAVHQIESPAIDVDETALAATLAADLKANLPASIVAALGAALVNG